MFQFVAGSPPDHCPLLKKEESLKKKSLLNEIYTEILISTTFSIISNALNVNSII